MAWQDHNCTALFNDGSAFALASDAQRPFQRNTDRLCCDDADLTGDVYAAECEGVPREK